MGMLFDKQKGKRQNLHFKIYTYLKFNLGRYRDLKTPMLIQLLRVKIQELIVIESSLSYPGSIALPEEIIEASGLKIFEQVHVNNLTNGNRIITYVIKSKKNGFVSLNGAASKKFNKGDKIHVLVFGYVNMYNEAEIAHPTIIYADATNRLIEVKEYAILE